MAYRGMGVWSATIEPKQYFLALYSSWPGLQLLHPCRQQPDNQCDPILGANVHAAYLSKPHIFFQTHVSNSFHPFNKVRQHKKTTIAYLLCTNQGHGLLFLFLWGSKIAFAWTYALTKNQSAAKTKRFERYQSNTRAYGTSCACFSHSFPSWPHAT